MPCAVWFPRVLRPRIGLYPHVVESRTVLCTAFAFYFGNLADLAVDEPKTALQGWQCGSPSPVDAAAPTPCATRNAVIRRDLRCRSSIARRLAPDDAAMLHFDWVVHTPEERARKIARYDAHTPNHGSAWRNYYLADTLEGFEASLEPIDLPEFANLTAALQLRSIR